MILSMVSATMQVFKPSSASAAGCSGATAGSGAGDMDDSESQVEYRQFLVIGTAYAMHDVVETFDAR
jgi:hypothetical protein